MTEAFGQKGRRPLAEASSSIKRLLDFLLIEVALEQALKSLAVAGLIAGHQRVRGLVVLRPIRGMDRVGRDIVPMKVDNNHFRVIVSVAVSQQFFGWIFGLGKAVRIAGPESVKEQMKKALADIAARYEDE